MIKESSIIYDVILFYNENNLLEKRIKYFEDFKNIIHIVVEIDHSYNGKKRISAINKVLKSKVIHKFIEINEKDVNLSNPWDIEAFHRRCIMRLLKNERIKEGSIIIFSDADEIPSKKSIKTLKSLFANQYHENFYVFEQDWYWLSLKYKFKEKWLGSIGFKFSKTSNIDLEAERKLRDFRKKIKGGGKHLSYFLEEGEIINKLNSFAHCNDSRNKFFKNNFIDYIRLLSCNCMTSPFSKNRVLIQKEEILKKSFLKVFFLKIKLFGYDSIWVLLKILHKIKSNFLDNLIKLVFQLLALLSLIKQNLFLNFKIRFLYTFYEKKKIIYRLDNIAKFLRPSIFSCDLEWVGQKKGYYIPNINNLKYNPKYVISPGVGGSTEFEDYMYRNYQVNSITIDPNKSAYPPRYGNLKHLVGFLSSVSDKRNNLFSLADLRGEINPIDCILQIDIEGDEWNIFKEINFEIENYPILIVEFHYIIDNILNTNEDDRYKKIINILQKINKFYIPVFTHCNNLSKSMDYKGISMSNVLEVSYISKKLIEKEEIYFKKINFKRLIKKYPSPRTFKLYPEAFIFND